MQFRNQLIHDHIIIVVWRYITMMINKYKFDVYFTVHWQLHSESH